MVSYTAQNKDCGAKTRAFSLTQFAKFNMQSRVFTSSSSQNIHTVHDQMWYRRAHKYARVHKYHMVVLSIVVYTCVCLNAGRSFGSCACNNNFFYWEYLLDAGIYDALIIFDIYLIDSGAREKRRTKRFKIYLFFVSNIFFKTCAAYDEMRWMYILIFFACKSLCCVFMTITK